MRLAFQIAVRFLKSSKGQTILISLGIAIGVSVQIFIGSLIQGLQKSLVDTTIGSQPQITITSDGDDKLISNYEQIVERIAENEDEVINLSVAADAPALISKDTTTYSILLRGFNIEDADKIFDINNSLVEGALPRAEREVLVGVDLKDEAAISLGERIEILTVQNETALIEVVGFFDLGVSSLNKTWVVTDIKTVRDIFDFGDKVTSINMQVKNVFLADIVADSIETREDSEILVVDNWKAQNEDLLSGLNGQSVSSIMIQVFVMISVLLGIASILAITVVQKSKQIGILKAMGIKNKNASYIFLFQGLILGILGAIFGIIFGLLLAFSFTRFALNPDGTPVVPLFIDPIFITFSALIAVTAAVIAALIPARTSAKLSPIEVIRNA